MVWTLVSLLTIVFTLLLVTAMFTWVAPEDGGRQAINSNKTKNDKRECLTRGTVRRCIVWGKKNHESVFLKWSFEIKLQNARWMKSWGLFVSVYRNSSCSFRIDEIIYSSPFFASPPFVERDTGRWTYICKCLYWWKCIFAYPFKESHIHINELLEYFFYCIDTDAVISNICRSRWHDSLINASYL